MILLLTACGKQKEETVKIAQQYGLAYAPIQIMKELGFLEEELGDTKVEWVKLANTAAIREAVLADNLDVGFMGIPPFLIAVDKGMDWKIMTGLSRSPLGLITYKEGINKLSDFQKTDKIALPQPGSIQHILLAMACEQELGQADILDHQLVSMKHPDGMQALLAKQDITAHFTSPPYIFKELEEEGNHMVVSGEEAMGGPFTFIVGASTKSFYENSPKSYEAVLRALKRAIAYMENNEEETLQILGRLYSLDPETVKQYIHYEGMAYEMDILGVEKFVDFMVRNNYLDKSYKREDVIWE